MNNIFLEIAVILILVILNGIFAMSEIAIVSARKIKLQKMAKKGDKNAITALELANSPNLFLSTVQVGITLIGILAGAFGGATISIQLNNYFKTIPAIASYSEALSIVIVVLIITYLSLIIGELVPKRLAMNNPENISVKIARPMKIISRITMPIVSLLSLSTEAVLRLFGIKETATSTVTEEEIKLMIEEGIEAGTVEKEEEDIIKRVFRLDEQKIGSVMTPKTEIIYLDVDDPVKLNRNKIIESERSIFPVGQEGLNNLLGVVQTKDILSSVLQDEDIDLKSHLKKPLIVPETLPTLEILKIFKENSDYVHMALIVDEYGSIEGLITLNDILEAIVGDIPAIDEPDEPRAIKRKDGSYLVDGYLPVDEFKDIMEIEKLPEEDQSSYNTVAGFIMSYTGKIPETGELFTWNGLNFEIVDMDGNHIDKILVKKKK
ncbi:MAG: hemolysin family protein [Methanomicrobiales archaeon]